MRIYYKALTVTCDVCRTNFQVEGQGLTKQQAHAFAREDGWSLGTWDLCPSCRKLGHADRGLVALLVAGGTVTYAKMSDNLKRFLGAFEWDEHLIVYYGRGRNVGALLTIAGRTRAEGMCKKEST